MHLFCPACGKHIDVSVEEIENLQGHLVCPQCLESIDVDVPGNVEDPILDQQSPHDTINHEEAITTPVQQPAHQELPPQVPPPAPKPAPPQQQQPQQPQHIDSVMRYCKKCGSFLREGANFCPKCGNFVKVIPTPRATASPPPYRTPSQGSQLSNQGYQQSTSFSRPRPMTTNSRRPQPSKKGSKASGNSSGKFSIYSTSGCLIITLITVAIFFIAYIVLGINIEG